MKLNIHKLYSGIIAVLSMGCFFTSFGSLPTAEKLTELPKELLLEKAKLSLETTFRYDFSLEKTIKALGPLVSIALSPDQSKILVGYEKSGTAVLFNRQTGEKIETFKGGITGSVKGNFSSTGTLILTSSSNTLTKESELCVWALDNNKVPLMVLKGSSFISPVISSDNKHIAAGLDNGKVCIWDIGSGKEIRTFETGASTEMPVLSVCFSRDGTSVLVGTQEGNLYFFDRDTGIKKSVISLYKGKVELFIVSSTTNKALLVLPNKTACLWDIQTGKIVSMLINSKSSLSGAVFSADASTLVTSSYDKAVKLWDIKTGKELLLLDVAKDIVASAIDISADGNTILTTDQGVVSVWTRFSSGTQGFGFLTEKKITHRRHLSDIALSPDETLILVGQQRGGAVVLFDRKTGKEVKAFNAGNNGFSIAHFNSDGTLIITESYDDSINESQLRVWSVEKNDAPLCAVTGSSFNAPLLSPDNNYLIAGSDSGKVHMWDIASGKKIRTFDTKAQIPFPVLSVCFSPDGTTILAGTQDGKLYFFDRDTGTKKSVMNLHDGLVDLCILNATTSRALLGFSDGKACLWDTQTGKPLSSLKGHKRPLSSAAFSADGNLVVTGSWDGTVRLWDVKTGKELQRFELWGTSSSWVSMNKNGTRIVATNGKKVIIWSRSSLAYGAYEWQETRKSAVQEAFLKKCLLLFSQVPF